jgi:hypothetical protein
LPDLTLELFFGFEGAVVVAADARGEIGMPQAFNLRLVPGDAAA